MKKWRLILIMLIAGSLAMIQPAMAQGCSICSKTSMQQGEKPARGMNSGIVYLMLAPFVIVGYVGYRWYKKDYSDQES